MFKLFGLSRDVGAAKAGPAASPRSPHSPSRGQFLFSAMLIFSVLHTIAMLCIVLLAGIAYAQGAPPPAAADPMALLSAIYDAVHNGNGWMAAGPALALVVWALRKYDLKIPKVGPYIDAFLNQPVVAFLLPAVLSSLTGLFSALAQHLPLGPSLFTALKVAGAAAFSFLAAKNIAEQIKPAQAAGAAAAKDPGPTLGA